MNLTTGGEEYLNKLRNKHMKKDTTFIEDIKVILWTAAIGLIFGFCVVAGASLAQHLFPPL